MKYLSRHTLALINGLRLPRLLMSFIVFISAGCGDDGFDPKSVLSSYRVLALRADPPEVALTPTGVTESVLSLYDFHPGDLTGDRPKIEYEWRLCPFSLGSVTQYDCLLDEIPLSGDVIISTMNDIESESESGDAPQVDEDEDGEIEPAEINLPLASAQVTINPIELLNSLSDDLEMQLEQLEMGAGMLGSEMNFFESGALEVYLKLTVKIEGEPNFELVKSINVILDEEIEPNQNPTIQDLISDQDLNKEIPLKIESEISLEVTAAEESAETYQELQSADALESGVEPEEAVESLLVSYYTTSGRFDQAVKLIEEPEVKLTLGEEPGQHILFVVMRDGRGGVDLRKRVFLLD